MVTSSWRYVKKLRDHGQIGLSNFERRKKKRNRKIERHLTEMRFGIRKFGWTQSTMYVENPRSDWNPAEIDAYVANRGAVWHWRSTCATRSYLRVFLPSGNSTAKNASQGKCHLRLLRLPMTFFFLKTRLSLTKDQPKIFMEINDTSSKLSLIEA